MHGHHTRSAFQSAIGACCRLDASWTALEATKGEPPRFKGELRYSEESWLDGLMIVRILWAAAREEDVQNDQRGADTDTGVCYVDDRKAA